MPLGQPEPSTKPNSNQSSQAPSPNQPLELESINTEVGERLGFRQKIDCGMGFGHLYTPSGPTVC